MPLVSYVQSKMSSNIKLKNPGPMIYNAVASASPPRIPNVLQQIMPSNANTNSPSAGANSPSPSEPLIEGDYDPAFAPVVDLFSKGFRDGSEAEAQLCVYHKGRKVIDVWGRASPSAAENVDDFPPYDGDSLQVVFSSSKVLTSVVVACLVDRGLLSYDDPVCKHWPEFAEADKAGLRVCDVLRHEAGLVHLSKTVMFEEMLPESIKRNSIGAVIEKEPCVFPPESSGTDREYHGLTRGWILNEIFR